MSQPLVIDVSHHNPPPEPNWAKVKAGGTVGVILKATEGTTYIDPTFGQRREAAKAAGLAVSSYHFLKHGDARWQMLHYLDVVAPAIGERVVIDYEDAACTLDDLREAVLALRNNAGLGLQITIYAGGLIKGQLGDNHDREVWDKANAGDYGPIAPYAVSVLQKITNAPEDLFGGPTLGEIFHGN
ncbi:glycoside hydrolase family 25 protein [Mesorhizobium sp. M0293]|uniref:glycoside hydrolase family 25 protein n=1 Tax=Mesorhizobium sp. M0293 TaxID=2956930 RepID=UPI003337A82B